MNQLKIALTLSLNLVVFITACSQAQERNQKNNKRNKLMSLEVSSDSEDWNDLTPEEERVIVYKGTEAIFRGEYVDTKEKGVYLCRRCNNPLFKSESKFDSGSGWPAFDDFIAGAVKEIPDADGRRVEIVCANCGGHLGHVFRGEGFTSKNTRHCVNSISMTLVSDDELKKKQKSESNLDTAIFASGCFWGTEYFFEKAEGVISTQVGYIGGHKANPTYQEVCAKKTGHAEAVRVVYDPTKTDYETLAKLFFETHDPTQVNRQGPDIGDQYRTEIFYLNQDQKKIAERLIDQLRKDGLNIATKVTEATTFWEGEDYHEHYYEKKGGTPYCHRYIKRFED